MKKIWQYGRTGGVELEVSDNFLVQVPFTEVPPLEGERPDGEPLSINDQMFDPTESRWIVLANVLDHNDLNNLKVMYQKLKQENSDLKQLNSKLMLNDVAIKQENASLKQKADSLAQINSKTMLVSLQNSQEIAKIKEEFTVNEGGKENV